MPRSSYPHWEVQEKRVNTDRGGVRPAYLNAVHGWIREAWSRFSEDVRGEYRDTPREPRDQPAIQRPLRNTQSPYNEKTAFRSWLQALVEATYDIIEEGFASGELHVPALEELVDQHGENSRQLYTALFVISCWEDNLTAQSADKQIKNSTVCNAARLGPRGVKKLLKDAEAAKRGETRDVAPPKARQEETTSPPAPGAPRSAAGAPEGSSSRAPSEDIPGGPAASPTEAAPPRSADSSRDPLDVHFPDLSRLDREALSRFARAARAGRGLLLLGSNVAARCGLPSTAKLVQYFREVTEAPLEDLRSLCSLYEEKVGPETLREKLIQLLDDWQKPLSPIHQLIPQLPIRYIVTTCVDRQIEEACRQLRRAYCVFSLPQDLAWGRPDLMSILKIRGTLDHPHTLVFSREDYGRAFADEKFGAEIRALLRNHPTIAVGLSAEDPDFDQLKRWIRDNGDGHAIIVVFDDPAQATRCRHKGITPILVPDRGGVLGAERIPLLLGVISGLPAQRVPTELKRVDRRRNPFRRLEAYCEEDEARFSGRDERRAVVLRLLEQYRALLLFGESGVGKSSFLQAALVPELKRLHGANSVHIDNSTEDLPARWKKLTARVAPGCPYVLILDQLERFFDESTVEGRRSFLLEELPRTFEEHPGLKILFAIRRDRLADVHPYKDDYPGLYHESLELPPLTATQASEVLLRHFVDQGYTLTDTLAKTIVAQCSNDGVPFLPALQLYGHALFEHAEALRLDGKLLADGVLDEPQAPRRTDVLQRFVEEALQVFAAGERRLTLLQVLRRLALHSRRQQLRADRLADEFPDPDAARAVLNQLVNKRLVRFVPERNAYELVHDALVGALEAGPLSAPQDYTKADLIIFYTVPSRRANASAAQRLGLLRYSLRQGLPVHPWLGLLEEVGLDPQEVLLDLCRDADAGLAAASIALLGEIGDKDKLRGDHVLHRYLIEVVMGAIDEEEDSNKGERALRLLLQNSLTQSDAQRFLDIVDPTRQNDEGRREFPLSDKSRALIGAALPAVLELIPDEELCSLARVPALDIEDDLGVEIYAEILVALGRRGLLDELLTRCRTLLNDGDDSAFNPDPVFLALARLPGDLRPLDAFDEIRRQLMAGLRAMAFSELVPALITIMGQLGSREPSEVMWHWLQVFPQFAHDEELWPRWRGLAGELIANTAAREMLLFHLAATYSPSEQASLSEVLLWARPGPLLAKAESDSDTAQAAQLLAGLGATLAERLRAASSLPELEDLRAAVAEMSPLALWRNGVALADSASTPARRRWEGTRLLVGATLDKVVRIATKHGFTTPDSLDRMKVADQSALIRALNEWNEDAIERRWRIRRDNLVELLKKTPAVIAAAQPSLAIERIQHWLNVTLVTTPRLGSPHAVWPPIGSPAEQLPALTRLMQALDLADTPTDSGLAAHIDALRRAHVEWAAAQSEGVGLLLDVAVWLLYQAAGIAAEDGDEVYGRWLRELKEDSVASLDPDTIRVTSPDLSRLRWLFRCAQVEALGWALRSDPREAMADEEEIGWLIESTLECGEPATVPAPLRVWVTDTLRAACAEDEVLTDSAHVGELFERLCRTSWAPALSPAFSTDNLDVMLLSLQDTFKRAALLLWAESDHEDLLKDVVELALDRSTPLRPHAVAALDRWFARRRPVT